jgi:CubicO group peptidase (beta-lactamase class C family)
MIMVFRKTHLAAAKPFCVSVLFGLVLHGTGESQELRGTEELNNGKVDDLVQAVMKQEHVPGLALAVVKGGKILKAQAYGLAHVEKKIQATTNTVFRIASVSKQFVATAIMMLVEEGKLSLEDSVSKYVTGTPRKWKGITIRHLLTHTSGIPDFLNEDIPLDTRLDDFDQAVVKALADRPLHFAPGDDWRYSNSNYHLLGMIIRRITGMPYGDFLGERIFQPLGMRQTAVSPIDGNFPGLAVGYEWNNDHLEPGDDVAPSTKAYAGGGIVSTAPDMAKWDAALYTEKLLKQSSLQQMWTPVCLNDGMKAPYGFGWGTLGRPWKSGLVVSHGGNFTGFSSYIYRAVDDRLTVIILVNRFASDGAVGVLSKKIARLYVWKGPDYKPIQDNEPEITAHIRDILHRGGLGTSREVDFTSTEWAEWAPWQKQMQESSKATGPVLSLDLVECTLQSGKRSYRYRVQYKPATVLFHIILDEQNRVDSWTIEDEALN